MKKNPFDIENRLKYIVRNYYLGTDSEFKTYKEAERRYKRDIKEYEKEKKKGNAIYTVPGWVIVLLVVKQEIIAGHKP